MAIFNPLDVDKWRNLISSFDVRRQQFFEALASLKTERGATPALEQERRKLLGKAVGIEKEINRFMDTANKVRGWISNLSRAIGLSSVETMGQLNALPILLIGVGIGAAALIVKSITDWLTKTASFNAKNVQAKILADAGATPDQIIKSQKGMMTSSSKLFGFDVRWVLAIGAMFVIAPFAIKQIQKRR